MFEIRDLSVGGVDRTLSVASHIVYLDKCSLLNIEKLSDMRNNEKLLFVFDFLSGRIDLPKLLSSFDINIPSRPLRKYSFFRIRHHRTNYGSFEPVLIILSFFNRIKWAIKISCIFF